MLLPNRDSVTNMFTVMILDSRNETRLRFGEGAQSPYHMIVQSTTLPVSLILKFDDQIQICFKPCRRQKPN